MNLRAKLDQNFDQKEEKRRVVEALLPHLEEIRDNFEPIENASDAKMRKSLLGAFQSAFPELAAYNFSTIKRIIKQMEELASPESKTAADQAPDKEPGEPDTEMTAASNPEEPVSPEDEPASPESGPASPEDQEAVVEALDSGLADLDRQTKEEEIEIAEASQGLEDNPEFKEGLAKLEAESEAVKADSGRKLLAKLKDFPGKLFDRVKDFFAEWRAKREERIQQASERLDALEKEASVQEQEEKIAADSLKQKYYSSMAPRIKDVFRRPLAGVASKDLESSRIFQFVMDDNDNAVVFYFSGFYLRLKNKEECQVTEGEGEDKRSTINIWSDRGLYDLVSPQDEIILQDVGYEQARQKLAELAEPYQENLKKEIDLGQPELSGELETPPEPETNPAPKPNSPEPVPAPEPAAPEDQPEGQPEKPAEKILSPVGQQLKEFNITVEEIAADNWRFGELSEGQQYLILKNLQQVARDQIKEKALQEYQADISRSGWWKGKWKKATRAYQLSRLEKEQAQAIHDQGYEASKDSLAVLSQAMYDSGPAVQLVEKEDGKFGLDIDFFTAPEYYGQEGQALVKEYNQVATEFSTIPEEWGLKVAGLKKTHVQGSEKFEKWNQAKGAYEAKETELIAFLKKQGSYSGLKPEEIEADILHNLNRSRAQIAYQRFLKTVPEAENVLSGLREQKAWKQMLNTTFGERAAYSAGGFALRSLMVGKVGTIALPTAGLAVGSIVAIPTVGALVGGLRGWKQEQKSLKEQDWLARHGQAKTGKTAANFVAAGNRPEKPGANPRITAGLSGKLNILLDQLDVLDSGREILEEKPVLDEKGRLVVLESRPQTDGMIVESTVARDPEGKLSFSGDAQKDEQGEVLIKIKKEARSLKREDLLQAINDRLAYTERKLGEGLIDFGSGPTRLQNQADLAQAMGQARAHLELARDPNHPETNVYLSSSAVQERLDKVLDLKSQHLGQVRRQELLKAAAKGAVMGAAFAFAGAKLRDFLFGGPSVGGSGGSRAAEAVSPDQEVPATPDDAVTAEHLSQADNALPTKSGLDQAKILEELRRQDSLARAVPRSGLESEVDQVETPAARIPGNRLSSPDQFDSPSAVPATPESPAASSGIYEDEISNNGLDQGQHDSVWRSTKTIFESHAKDLGYKGDLNDQEALEAWADNQTAKALSQTENLTDKVFEGNRVVLEQGEHGYQVRVETGSGFKPGNLVDHSGSSDFNPDHDLASSQSGSGTEPLSSSEFSGVTPPDSLGDQDLSPEFRSFLAGQKSGTNLDQDLFRSGSNGETPIDVPESILKANHIDPSQLNEFERLTLEHKWDQELASKTDSLLRDLRDNHERLFFKHLKGMKGERLTRSERAFWESMADDYKNSSDKGQWLSSLGGKMKTGLKAMIK